MNRSAAFPPDGIQNPPIPGVNDLKRHSLTFSIILTLIAGMVLCAVPVQGISANSECGAIFCRAADFRSGYSAQYSAVLSALAGGAKPEFGSVGGEWKVLALARSGYYSVQNSYFSEYYAQIEKLVAANGTPKLHPQKSTENSRLIIALSAIGRDARDVSGFDLTEPLSDINYVRKQGLNGVIFALIALDCNKAYGMSGIKDQCIDIMLSRECDGGGWALGLGAAEADITAMAITALAPHKKASAAVKRGVEKLSTLQNANGSFSSGGVETSESCSQVLVALSTVGIDAHRDARFIKNGNSALDALGAFYVNGGFAHMANGGKNSMATEQAAYALCAYDRFVSGKSTLYGMSDVSPFSTAAPTEKPTSKPSAKPTEQPAETPHAENTAGAETPSPTNSPSPEPTDSAEVVTTESAAPSASNELNNSPSPATLSPAQTDAPTSETTRGSGNGGAVVLGCAAVCAVGIAVFFIIRKRKNKV